MRSFSAQCPHGTRLLLALLAVLGCQPTVGALGVTPSGTPHGADVMEAVAVHLRREGMADGFGPHQARLTRELMTPSGLYEDPAWWTTRSAQSRVLHFGGTRQGARYEMVPHTQPRMDQVGDARYAFELRQRAEAEFEWNTVEDYQIGSVDPARVIGAVRATFAAPAHAPNGALLPLLHEQFPLADAAFARLGTMEEAAGTVLADGSLLGRMKILLDPQRTRAAGFPYLAKYLDRYITPMRLDGKLTDLQGRTLFSLTMVKNRLEMKWRAVEGRFVPLDGPLLPPPERWRVVFSISSHVLLWDAGAKNVEMDVTGIDDGREVGWLMRFGKTPTWDFPPGVVRMLGGSLEKPFQDGILLRMTIGKDGPRTVATRRIHAVLEESVLMRWVGRLVSAISEDFVERTQADGYRFFRQGADAYRADIVNLAARGASAPQ